MSSFLYHMTKTQSLTSASCPLRSVCISSQDPYVSVSVFNYWLICLSVSLSRDTSPHPAPADKDGWGRWDPVVHTGISLWLPSRGMEQRQTRTHTRTNNITGWSFSRCVFRGVDSVYCEIPFRVQCVCIGRVGPQTAAPSLMYVCLQPPAPPSDTLTLKWGQIVSWTSLPCVL